VNGHSWLKDWGLNMKPANTHAFAKIDAAIKGAARFVADKSGATAIEYALIAGLIALAIIPAMALVGMNNGGMWSKVSANVAAATQ
jgi:pilus assembly protein Flp/PilA